LASSQASGLLTEEVPEFLDLGPRDPLIADQLPSAGHARQLVEGHTEMAEDRIPLGANLVASRVIDRSHALTVAVGADRRPDTRGRFIFGDLTPTADAVLVRANWPGIM